MFFPEAFAAVAACYKEPASGLPQKLDPLCGPQPVHEGISPPDIRELKNRFETGDPEELRLDHTRLFVGPFELVAPPFGSVYLDGKRTLMGESTRSAMELYRRAGLDMAEDFNNPPDHVIAELEFLAYLHSARQAADDDDTLHLLRDLHHQFVRQHIGTWIEPFTSKMEQGAETGFYQLLAAVTRSLVLAEARAAE
ncbi:TorA maturation chaperone TorD [Desulfosalsimonas propionicica]|uniref:TorA maturation chaperone TorD n=1 Tax=Desulfosalsimonas propionicica TaxID=332175 RepID=A0A7W0HL40_9BACT|nr:molecular chaperone TorD family protein [Desulfosalsimonas propionicica]MBA2881855.1 TorA maturation chaperone TorD [Desulfosalsimonas propionicica]